ncbi:tetratricopeptide repeat protein [Psychrobacter sp. JB385]|uniref:tetratricopeptide repeat protein n=1 Tax=Psychrobacter sp. JB385 TaxID=1434841 RepID=UPI00097F5CAE|nr:tetratricopeptide repeat protein [Psychrobacter sp. JB385]SJN15946.1 hypothetical protein CZ794_00675 [Psychrobacter sp. JB385]
MKSSDYLYTVEDLAQFMDISKKAGNPFIFITGAGCSVTADIPLAKEIVSELNEIFALELKPLSDKDRKDYGKCMGRLETSKRREYLQNYIGKAKINWAHIALACLMKEGYIRRVLTFNFDNLLARSCGLLGQYPPTYDFTAANLNLHRLIDDPAIVHLHGQGHGFVQLNTESETEEHAARLKEFVAHTLSESPTLFIGYSGSNDAFLPQIEEQFSDQHRLFWVDMNDKAPEHLQQKLLTSSLAHYMSCKNGADLFLIELAQKLECFPPTIFVDPYQHVLDELDEVADYPVLKHDHLDDRKESQLTQSDTSTQDILLETKNRLKEVQQQDKEREHDFLQEYLQGDYEGAVKALEEKQQLNIEQSLWLARSYLSLALEEPNELEKIRIYEKLIDKFKESVEIDIQEQVGSALVNKAVALGELQQPYDEIKTYDELVTRFSDSNNLVLREHVAVALLNKTVALYEFGQLDKAVEVCDEIIARFSDSDETILQKQIAKALLNKAVALGRLKQLNKAVEVCDELIVRFSDSDELTFQEQVAKAAFNKAVATEKLGQLDQAIEIYDELIVRFSDSDELIFQEQVAKALLNKGSILTELEQSDKSVQVYNELIAKFGESNEVGLQELLSVAFNNIGYLRLLAAKKHWQKNPSIAKDYLDTALKCFSKAITKSSRDDHALILGNLAYTEFLQGDMAESEILLRKVLQQGGQSLYNQVLEDINKYTIDPDINFKTLLEKLWNEINK